MHVGFHIVPATKMCKASCNNNTVKEMNTLSLTLNTFACVKFNAECSLLMEYYCIEVLIVVIQYVM